MKLSILLSLLAMMAPASAWANHIQDQQATEASQSDPSDEGQEFLREIHEHCEEWPYPFSSSVKPSKLSDLEWSALLLYTGNGYRCVNAHLREHTASRVPTFVKFMDSALQKFPRCKKTIFRGEFPNSLHTLPKIGSQITDPAYLSTSIRPQVASRFGSIQYEIHATNCRDVSSVNKTEGEVICPRDTTFKVRSVKSDGNVTQYVLDEVLPHASKEGS